MKLATFSSAADPCARLGVVVGTRVIAFETLQNCRGGNGFELARIQQYLENLPASATTAARLYDYGLKIVDELPPQACPALDQVRLLPPIPAPPGVFDFGLSPRHLKNAAATLIRHEFNPLIGVLLKPIINRLLAKKAESAILPYFKQNSQTISGPDDQLHWPAYTAYLDVEPELAIVTGPSPDIIAGYLIYNDVSARDIQWPEMTGTGPARSKDFDRGNGIGPFLVTPDEIDNPLDLAVAVAIGDRFRWHGHTREYTTSPTELLRYLFSVFTPHPGTILGMGTIPDCCGLDHNLWLHPGDRIEIEIQGLGVLRQYIPSQIGPLQADRWTRRPELEPFYAPFASR